MSGRDMIEARRAELLRRVAVLGIATDFLDALGAEMEAPVGIEVADGDLVLVIPDVMAAGPLRVAPPAPWDPAPPDTGGCGDDGGAGAEAGDAAADGAAQVPVADPEVHAAPEPVADPGPEGDAAPQRGPDPGRGEVENRSGLPWAPWEDARIIDMARAGAAPREIAETLGRTRAAVTTRMQNAALRDRIRGRAPTAPGSAGSAAQPRLSTDAPAAARQPMAASPAAEHGTAPRALRAAAALRAGTPERAAEYSPRQSPAPAPPPAPPPGDGTPGWLCDLRAHLDALGHGGPWSPELDLRLVGGVTGGLKLAVAAEACGVTLADARARWRALLPEPGLEAQTRLLEELRRRAAAASWAGVA